MRQILIYLLLRFSKHVAEFIVTDLERVSIRCMYNTGSRDGGYCPHGGISKINHT